MNVVESRLACGADPVLTQGRILRQISWTAKSGFSGIELYADSLDHFRTVYSKAFAKQIDHELRRNQLNVPQFLCNFFIPLILNDSKRDSTNILNEILQTVLEVGCGTLAVVSSPPPGIVAEYTSAYLGGPPTRITLGSNFNWKTAWERYVDAISLLTDLTSSVGLKLALEPRPREMISSSDGLLSLMLAVSSPNLGALIDTAHMFVQREYIPLSIMKLQDRIFAVHLTDSDGLVEHHWAPGEGKIEWKEVLRAFSSIKYDRAFTINAFGILSSPEEEFLGAKSYLENLLSSMTTLEAIT